MECQFRLGHRKQQIELRIQSDVVDPDNARLVASRVLAHHGQAVDAQKMFFGGAAAGEGHLDVAHHVDVDVLFDGVLARRCQHLEIIIKLTIINFIYRYIKEFRIVSWWNILVTMRKRKTLGLFH